MLKENIHIVFGRTRRTLIDSQVFDLNKNQIISLDDNLNIGPVCDVYENENIRNRKDWLKKVFGDISYFDDIQNTVEQDLKSIETIVENAHHIDNIYIWTGYYASEIISTARLIDHLSKLNKPIFIANYPNTPVKSIHGDTIYPKAVVQTAAFQIKDIFEQFKLIEKDRLSYWINLWSKVKLENGELRILNENGQITAENTDYFDSCLLSNCNRNFQKAAMVIGTTLVDIDFSVNDDFLNWRLKKLARNEKIESQGKLIEIRDYEVRKI